MDETYKRSIKKSYLHQLKKQRTREEKKQIRERSRRRKAEIGQKKRARSGDWRHAGEDEDEDALFERMRSSRDLPPLERTGPRALDAGREEPLPPALAGAPRALVCSTARGRAAVLLDGERLELPLRRELAEAQQGAIAAGDQVLIEEPAPGVQRVAAVLPRRSVLSRPDPGNPRRELVLAANVDLGVVVVTRERAPLKPGLVDRFLVALGRGGVGALVCVNKADLLEAPSARAGLERELRPYAELGVPTLLVSAESGEGLADLRAALESKTCVLVGQSGVGKSSLLNALDPATARPTRETRERDGRGRHTTTASDLTELSGGTRAIDTPGIRAFGLGRLHPEELTDAFPELAAEAQACRFSDCSHLHEPACGVRAALEAGRISPARYASYARILASE